MYGSDWPVVLISRPYEDWFNLVRRYCSRFTKKQITERYHAMKLETATSHFEHRPVFRSIEFLIRTGHGIFGKKDVVLAVSSAFPTLIIKEIIERTGFKFKTLGEFSDMAHYAGRDYLGEVVREIKKKMFPNH